MLFSFGSEKGGVGKSYCAISFAQYLRYRLGRRVVIAECNREIPDVGRRFAADGNFVVEQVDVRAGNWARFGDLFDEYPDAIVIANWPSNVEGTFAAERQATIMGLRAMDVPVVLAWTMNVGGDGIMALRREVELCDYEPHELLCIANLIHGRIEDFAWHRSATRKQYLHEGAIEIDMPAQYVPMAQLYVDPCFNFSQMRAGEASIDGIDRLSSGPRLSLRHWIVRIQDPIWDKVAEHFGLREADAAVPAR